MWTRLNPRRSAAQERDRRERHAHRLRERLAALETEHCELLVDESRPARKHRIDAVAGARDDVRAELARLERP